MPKARKMKSGDEKRITLNKPLMGDLIKIQRTRNEFIVLSSGSYNGKPYIGLRVFFKNEIGDLCPTKRGFNFKPYQIPELLDGLLNMVRALPCPKVLIDELEKSTGPIVEELKAWRDSVIEQEMIKNEERNPAKVEKRKTKKAKTTGRRRKGPSVEERINSLEKNTSGKSQKSKD